MIQKEHQKEGKKIKTVILSLKELMKDDENALKVKQQLDILEQLSENAIELHISLMHLIPSAEQERLNKWFTSINKTNQGFNKDGKVWLSEISQRPCRPPSELPHNEERPQKKQSS